MTEILDHPNYSEFLRVNGVILDGEIAITVAEAVLKPVFGNEYTAKFAPYGKSWTAWALCRSCAGERYYESLALISAGAT